MHVEHDDVDLVGAELRARLGQRPGLEHVPTRELQVDPAEEPNRSVVVDDEHGVARRVHAEGESSPVPRSLLRSFTS